MLEVANPTFAKFGISISWKMNQTDTHVEAACVLSHKQGHEKIHDAISIPIMEPIKGQKGSVTNIAQMVLVATTYAKRGSLGTATGMATEDIDGNGTTPKSKPAELPSYSDTRFKNQYPTWKKV